METFKDINGNTKYVCKYEKGIMKQIGKLNCSIAEEGATIYRTEIAPAEEFSRKMNGTSVSLLEIVADVYSAGYLAGIRAERAKRKKKS